MCAGAQLRPLLPRASHAQAVSIGELWGGGATGLARVAGAGSRELEGGEVVTAPAVACR